jgi:hypothetical protein
MPLAALFTLQFYGPACAAMVVSDALGTLDQAGARMDKRFALTVDGQGTAVTLRPYRLRTFALDAGGAGYLHLATPKRNVRAGLTVTLGALSQDDVTGAVLEAKVEGDLTLKGALRYLLSVAQGNATGLGGPDVAYKSLDGGTTRIAGSVVDGTRTITTRNPA